MKIRRALVSDKTTLYSLYKEVARNSGGIARLEEEITDQYIESLLESASKDVLMLLGLEEETEEVIAEIHAFKYGIRIFDHILTHLTLVVHPDFQGQGVGKRLLSSLLVEVQKNRPDIARIELESRASNQKSIGLYQSTGFVQEGKMRNKTRNKDGSFEDSVLMAWTNPEFKNG